MFEFPKNLYTDVRIEEAHTTKIAYKNKTIQEEKIRRNKGAFVRVFDGERWYYSSTTDVDRLQEKIDELASMANPKEGLEDHPIVKAFETNQDKILQYEETDVSKVPAHKKRELMEEYLSLLDVEGIAHHKSFYVDNRIVKSFYSSKGAAVTFDKQTCGIRMDMDVVFGKKKDQVGVSRGAVHFEELAGLQEYFQTEIDKNLDYVKNAEPVEAGTYPVLLSPTATGVFTHESFGHKSESDFMVGDETMAKEWKLGKRIGQKHLNIVDDGNVRGNGYVPYDDEGTKGKKTRIITDGELTGRLHSTLTAALMEEGQTGNARAVDFEYEPIVRMSTTYIEKGDTPLDEMIANVRNGVFIDTIKHGSGMSTFTLAPARAYKIEDGNITTPINVSVVTGNVFETLALVDNLSEEFDLLSFVGGGCGKMEQFPLPVGFGGPYTLVRELKVE